MKKILHSLNAGSHYITKAIVLLALLLTGAGQSWAQTSITDGETYYIANVVTAAHSKNYISYSTVTQKVTYGKRIPGDESLWTAVATGTADQYRFRNVKDPSKFLIAANDGVNTTGSTFVIYEGTSEEYVALYHDSNRYMAGYSGTYDGATGVGTRYGYGNYGSGGAWASTTKTQQSDWSTDWVLEPASSNSYSLQWAGVPAGQKGSMTYKDTRYTSDDNFVEIVGTNIIGRSEISVDDITVGDVTYRGTVAVDNTQEPRLITITYAQLPQNVFTVRVNTVTTTSLGTIIYGDNNYIHGANITFAPDVTSSTVKAAVDAAGKNVVVSGNTFDHIINADNITQYADIMIKGTDGQLHKLSATPYENYYVQMTVEGQTIAIRYISNDKPVTITYQVFYKGEHQFDRVMQGNVGHPYPRVDKDFDPSENGPYSTLPYGVKVIDYPATVVMGDATIQLQTEYVYSAIPFYPEGTRFTKIDTWYAASIGCATIDRTHGTQPTDSSSPAEWAQYAAKHAGAYYFYNNNGVLAIDKERMVKQETEYWTLEDMQPAYAWAMIGSPYRFRLMNRLAGAGQYLRWNADIDGEGFFSFDTEGTYFSIVYNYSVRPGDYGWAGYLPAYDIPEMGIDGYCPYVFGCSVMIPEEITDAEGHLFNRVLTITRDAESNAMSITMKNTPMYVDLLTPGGPLGPPTFRPGFGTDDITTMKPDCRVYMSTLSNDFADVSYTITTEIPSGDVLAGTGVTYNGEDRNPGEVLSFSTPPANDVFVARSVDGYEGIVSIDNARHEIVVTYLREGNDDFYYVRNTKEWSGFFVDNTAAGYFTPDPRNACLIYPIRTGATSGIVRGKAYTDVETFYIYEKQSGFYWTDTDVSMSQIYADRYVFVDENGVPVDRATLLSGKNVAIVNVRDFALGSDLSTNIPYSIYNPVESELLVGPLKSEWQLIRYVEPRPVTVSIFHSSETGVHTPLSSAVVHYGKKAVTNGSTIYTIETGHRLPGLVIPIINPQSETPNLYAYNLDVNAGTLTILYQDCHLIASAETLIQHVMQGHHFGLYNRNGKGFIVYDPANNFNHAQVVGAWNIEDSNMAKDAYSQPVSIFTGNATWDVEIDFANDGVTPIGFYLKNSATGYYCAENEDGTYTFSSMRSPVRIIDFQADHFQAEANAANTTTFAGIDLADPNAPIKTMAPGELTQFCLVVPSDQTIFYTIESNLTNGGVILRATGDGYSQKDRLFYTVPITDALIDRFLQAAPIPGYKASIAVSNDLMTHTGVITITYHSDVDNASQPFLVHGGSDFNEHTSYWNNSTSAVLGSTIAPMGYQMIAFEEAPAVLTQDYTIAYGGATTATLPAGTKTYYLRAAFDGAAATYGKYLGFNISANPTGVSPAAFEYTTEKTMPVALFEVPGHANQYYFIPVASLRADGVSTLAMVWSAGHTDGAAMALGTMNITAPAVTTPFEMEPSTEVDYNIVITGNDEGRVAIGNSEYVHGDMLHSRRILTSESIRVKPRDGYHYTFKVTQNTIEVNYTEHRLVTSVDDLRSGVLYTLRTTINTEGHDTHGYYTSDNVCVGDYDDINQHAINYTDRTFLWQNVVVGDDLYSWSEELGHAVGVSLPISLANTYMADGTWKFEETEMTSVAPYYTIDFVNYPKRLKEAVGNPVDDGLRVVLSSSLAETWTPAPQPFSIDAVGHGEGPFLELGEHMALPELQYNDGGTWRTMTAEKARELGFYWPVSIDRVTNAYFITFTETLEHLQQRANYLTTSVHRGDYFYPTVEEYATLEAAVASSCSLADGGLADPATAAARQTIAEAIAHFTRSDVPVKWPEETQLLYITNYQSTSALYHKYGDPLSRMKNPESDGTIADGHPTAFWSFEHVGGHHYRLHNANGDITDVNCFTAFEMGHPEWPGSLFNVHLATDGVFFDPMADIIEIDPATGSFGPATFTPLKDHRYSLLSNLVDGFTFTHEEMAAMPNAYWGVKDAVLPSGHTRYTVVVSGVPEGVPQQPVVECTHITHSPSHTVDFAYEGGFFLLADDSYSDGDSWTSAEASTAYFRATDYGNGSAYTITLDKPEGLLHLDYSLNDFYWEQLDHEAHAALALIDEATAQAIDHALHADPLTYGYPTQSARDALQDVITPILHTLAEHDADRDYIDSALYSEFSQLLASAVNTYNTTNDVITPQQDDVIILHGIVDNGNVSTYVTRHVEGFLVGERVLSGQRPQTDNFSDADSGGDYRNYWVLRPCEIPDFYYLQSGYGDHIYLTAEGISDLPQPWHFANGTQKGRLAMYYYDVMNSRFVETGYTLDAGGNVSSRFMGGEYSSSYKVQDADRSTDFGVEQMDCTPLYLKVEGADAASLTMVKQVFSGKRFITDGEMLVQKAAFVAGLVATLGSNKVPAALLAEYLLPSIVDGKTPYFSYDAASHVLTLTYEEDIEPFRERMLAYIYNAQFVDIVSGTEKADIISTATTAVSDASTVDEIKAAMHTFFLSLEGKTFSLQNKHTGYYLNSVGGASLMPTPAATATTSLYTLIYVGDDTEPIYLVHNIGQGNYIAPTTAVHMTSTVTQSLAGSFFMNALESDGQNYLMFTCQNGLPGQGNVLSHEAPGLEASATTRYGSPTNVMLWGVQPEVNNLPLTGNYYYLPNTATPISTANLDNPAVMCEVTRNGSQFIVRPLYSQTTSYTLTLTEAQAQAWTPVALPADEYLAEEYAKLLELYYMATMPTLGSEIGEYTDPHSGEAIGLVNSISNAVAALKTNNGAASPYNTEQGSSAFTQLNGAIIALQLNMPTTGFYRIKNAATGRYLSSEGFINDVICPVRHVNPANLSTDAASIFYFEAVTAPDADNMVTARLLNYGNGQYLYATNVVCYPEFQVDAHPFTIRFHSGSVGHYAFWYPDTQEFLSCGTNYSAVVKADGVGTPMAMQVLLAPEAGWQLERVTQLPVTVGKAGYATLYLPAAVTVPSGLTSVGRANNVLAGTAPAVGELNLNTISAGSTISAATPVIIRAAEGTYLFPISSYPATLTPVTTAGLRGIFATSTKEDVESSLPEGTEAYVLMKGKVNGTDQIGFYKDYIGNLNGFKAYLTYDSPADSNVRVFLFNFDGSEDAIRIPLAEPDATDENFDLMGRRIATQQPQRTPALRISRQGRKTFGQ